MQRDTARHVHESRDRGASWAPLVKGMEVVDKIKVGDVLRKASVRENPPKS